MREFADNVVCLGFFLAFVSLVSITLDSITLTRLFVIAGIYVLADLIRVIFFSLRKRGKAEGSRATSAA